MDDNSFFSIDKLVEFGMGMAIAQQMVNTMNKSMTNMHVPGAMNPMDSANKKEFFYAMIDGLQAGPFSDQEITRLISEKKVSKETYIWMPGMNNWKLAEQVPELLKLVALAPPPFKENK
mgnify:CR=1 FL=1